MSDVEWENGTRIKTEKYHDGFGATWVSLKINGTNIKMSEQEALSIAYAILDSLVDEDMLI